MEILRAEIFIIFRFAMEAKEGGALVVALNAQVDVSVMVSGTLVETRRLLTAVLLSVESELMAERSRCWGGPA